jgi:hypothetical protein
MSDSEFVSKVLLFKKQHTLCGEDCGHIDLFYKRMFVQNQLPKALKKIRQESVMVAGHKKKVKGQPGNNNKSY